MMSLLKLKVDRLSLEMMYKSFILPVIEYANVVWGGTYDSDLVKLETMNIKAMRIVTGATAKSNIQTLYVETGWQTIQERIEGSKLSLMYRIYSHSVPQYLYSALPVQN